MVSSPSLTVLHTFLHTYMGTVPVWRELCCKFLLPLMKSKRGGAGGQPNARVQAATEHAPANTIWGEGEGGRAAERESTGGHRAHPGQH